jgi:hypothetical protein
VSATSDAVPVERARIQMRSVPRVTTAWCA